MRRSNRYPIFRLTAVVVVLFLAAAAVVVSLPTRTVLTEPYIAFLAFEACLMASLAPWRIGR